MDQPNQESQGQPGPLGAPYVPPPPDPRAYLDPPAQPPPVFWQYGHGGSATQMYNNIQDYATGHAYNPLQQDQMQKEQEAQRQRSYAAGPALSEYQMIRGQGAGQMHEALQQVPGQEALAPRADIEVTDVDQNVPSHGGMQGEMGARSSFDN